MAVRTMLTKVVGWKGLSKNATFPRPSASRAANGFLSGPPPRCVNTTMGKSDHGGCFERRSASCRRSVVCRASSAMIASPAPAANSPHNEARSCVDFAATPASNRSFAAMSASRPRGASMIARSDRLPAFVTRLCRSSTCPGCRHNSGRHATRRETPPAALLQRGPHRRF
jgi:hypothetical protein